MDQPIKISIVNESTLFDDAQLPVLANALQIQTTRDFFPAWGVGAQIYFTPRGNKPTTDHWLLALLDDADQAGALGYHDVGKEGQPLGKVFVRTTLADQGLVSVTASHELVEMLVDPDISLCSQDGSILYAYESADAVEADADGYPITIPENWTGAGEQIQVSDFVFRSWWQSYRTAGPFDFKRLLQRPLELRPDGYVGYLDLNNLRAGWQQRNDATSARARMQSRPRPGSRRSRRALDKSQWETSTYPTGTAVSAIPADAQEIQNG